MELKTVKPKIRVVIYYNLILYSYKLNNEKNYKFVIVYIFYRDRYTQDIKSFLNYCNIKYTYKSYDKPKTDVFEVFWETININFILRNFKYTYLENLWPDFDLRVCRDKNIIFFQLFKKWIRNESYFWCDEDSIMDHFVMNELTFIVTDSLDENSNYYEVYKNYILFTFSSTSYFILRYTDNINMHDTTKDLIQSINYKRCLNFFFYMYNEEWVYVEKKYLHNINKNTLINHNPYFVIVKTDYRAYIRWYIIAKLLLLDFLNFLLKYYFRQYTIRKRHIVTLIVYYLFF